MRKVFFLFIFFSCCINIIGQTTIEGKIVNSKNQPIPFVNVYLEDIYDGGATNEEGFFSFVTEASDSVLFIASSLGLESIQQWIVLKENMRNTINFTMGASAMELNEVVITAGAFEASDEKKSTILKPLDIVQNPVAAGDLYGAIQTLPGVSKVGDETGIFVRGGEASETQTIIDGTIVDKPFFGQVPDVPSRGRFNPFLFKGTMFSTGGYSAEYGQALSSVLVLNTQDMPQQENVSFGANLAGLSISGTKIWNQKTALLGSVGYTNLSPYFNLIPQRRNWLKPPEGIGVNLGFRHALENGGMFKSYAQIQTGKIGINLDNPNDANLTTPFQNKNGNYYINNSYNGVLNNKWGIFAALAASKDDILLNIGDLSIDEKSFRSQVKTTVKGAISDDLYLRFGTDVMYRKEEGSTLVDSEFYSGKWSGIYGALYSEIDWKLSESFAVRFGLRGEYEEVIKDIAIQPRVSLAYKTGRRSQVSLAYGVFQQTPQTDFQRGFQGMTFESATHYILNYQWLSEDYTFRIEAYQKDYNNLNRYIDFFTRDNSGDGFAQGVDIFWRDKKTVKNLDYWISYSYVNGKRIYKDYPQKVTPNFITNHTLSLVSKYNFSKRLSTGVGYSYASGRPYNNPNTVAFLDARTIDYHNLTLNGSYLTNLMGHFTVFYFSISNPFGFDQVFGYQYSNDGTNRIAVVPSTRQSAFVGLFISFQQ